MLRVTRSEWARALALALVVVVMTSVPYALGLACPSCAPYLLEAFRTGDVTIYQVELL